jgi:uncharacterized protein (DUF1800 family)
MNRKTLLSSLIACVISITVNSSVNAQTNAPSATIVEYLHAESNKFYMSAIPAEWTLLDGNPQYGWKRTGVTFSAAVQGQTPDAKPVCRYYIIGAGSHFFSVDPAECSLVASYPQYFANEGIGWYAITATAGTCPANTTNLYRVYNNGAALKKASNHRYMADYSYYQNYAADGYALEGLAMCLPLSTTEKRADASRLMFQATFGARPSDIDTVVNRGASGWIDDQLNNAPASRYTPRDWASLTRPDTCMNNTAPPLTALSYCARDNYSLFQTQREFFQHAINNSDQLKQRLAWSWSQFFVVNAAEVGLAYGMGDYQQMLRDNATANFKTLLTKVTLHPAMGRMLDMANNLKPDAARGITPNENYAREIMQLFSLGLYQLNNDGTLKRDAKGLPIDTYSQEEVEDLAHVFTGWTYPTVPGQTARGLNPANTKGVMEERVAQHDTSARTLLGGTVSAGLTQSQRLDKALELIFNHPNVPPFVSKFLIQQFVTGEPSPSYVDRIAKVFQNNGAGVRGDMKAVVKAILMDIEARGAGKWAPNYGHQSEPVLMMTRLARAMYAQTDGVYFRTTTGAAGQSVFSAASVFNFYPPDYTLTKSGVIAPEFALYNTSSAISRVNAAYGTIFGNITPDATVLGATGTQFDLSTYAALASNPAALLDRMNDLLFAGRMTASTRAIIQPAIEAVNASDVTARVKTALYLSIIAPETQVLR